MSTKNSLMKALQDMTEVMTIQTQVVNEFTTDLESVKFGKRLAEIRAEIELEDQIDTLGKYAN